MAEQVKIKPVAEKRATSQAAHSPANEIKKRQTETLVLAFCGPVGSGISTVAEKLEEALPAFNYYVVKIKVSDFIKEAINKKKVDFAITEEDLRNPYSRIDKLQNGGNLLRQRYGNDILAQLAVKQVGMDLTNRSGAETLEEGKLPRESQRVAYLVDSLKHPSEVNLLRLVHGNMFYLFGVLCPELIRKRRLISNGMKDWQASQIMDKDKQEAEEYGQQLIDTLKYADFFIRNSRSADAPLSENLNRFIHLILGSKVITPTKDEYAMYVAQSAALRSACLSRQVGAVIVNSAGDIISTGCNDVPKAMGGLYLSEDRGDARCMSKTGGFCASDRHKKEIKEEFTKIISDVVPSGSTEITDKLITSTGVKDMIEFCRSVHAEMEAIVAAARSTTASTMDCTLYTTTFPCHNCARHIIAAGIKKVYYIEPYEKSLALKLHDDAIDLDSETPPEGRVAFLHFEGVSPRQYQNLFRPKEPRKKDGKLVKVAPEKAFPVIPKYLDSFHDYVAKIIDHLKSLDF